MAILEQMYASWNTPVILVVEDDDNDVVILEAAIKKLKPPVSVRVARSGEQAISYLDGKGEYADRPQHPIPDLVFLDIRLPGRSGFEVLEWIRQQPNLRNVKVVVLTGIERAQDVNRAYSLGASSFLLKPVELATLTQLAQLLGQRKLFSSGPGV